MAIELKSIRMQIDADQRLAAAAGGAARYLGDVAGLKTDAAVDLQNAIIAACEEAFDHLNAIHPHLEVRLTRLADRIEVALSHEGDSGPAIGLDAIAGFTSRFSLDGKRANSAVSVFQGIDRVQYESRGGTAVTLLTKYLTQRTPVA